MANLGRNRLFFAAIAAAVIIVGLFLSGGLPKPGTPAATAAEQPSSGAAKLDQPQAKQFPVRDYSEYGDGATPDLPSSDWLGLLLDLTLKLALVIGLLYLVIWGLRRYLYRGRPVTSGKKPVHLLGSLNLSPNRTVFVLEVGKKVLVVGATQSQMSLLTEVVDPEAIEEVRTLSAENPPLGQFSSLLTSARQQFGERGDTNLNAPLVTSLQLKVAEGSDFMLRKLAEVRRSLGQN